jgi:predicted  nucleic acid-binding Zn ribbon protein
MYLAELTFKIEASDDSVSHVLNWLIHALRMNGQICGREFPISVSAKGYSIHCLIPEPDALSTEHFNRYVRHAFADFQNVGLSKPTIAILGEDIDSAAICTCAVCDSYVLYTNYLSLESPLRCGNCFLPVPLYKIPPTYDEEYSDIISWQSDYQSCDHLHMNSTVLERAATRELSRADSKLSLSGRNICSKIFANTTKPTYYKLYRYYGRSRVQELKRKCPSCNGEWLCDPPWHLFDFKCERCHLVSYIAMSL